MTIKYFDNGRITIEYDKDGIVITDDYNSFRFSLDVKMKKYFVPYIERLYRICKGFYLSSIPTHNCIASEKTPEIFCNAISNCYRKYGTFQGNYMDIDRKDEIISAFKKCFKRVNEEDIDIDLSYLDLKSFNLRTLLSIKKGLLYEYHSDN